MVLSRRYSAASAFHRLRDNLKRPYQIASIFDMYIDIGERIAGKQDWPGSIIYGPPRAPPPPPPEEPKMHIFISHAAEGPGQEILQHPRLSVCLSVCPLSVHHV